MQEHESRGGRCQEGGDVGMGKLIDSFEIPIVY